MSVSLMDALEIFTHPRDLELSIVKEKGTNKYGICITRGPGHDFKLLITSSFSFEGSKEAIDATKGLLEVIEQTGIKEFSNPSSLISRICNPGKIALDENSILGPEQITRIIEELQKKLVASTYKMLAATG